MSTEIDYETRALTSAPEPKDPWWAKLVGSRYCDGKTARCWWGEFSAGRSPIGISIGAYETAHLNVAIGFCQAFVRIPALDRFADRSIEDSWRYGFSIHGLTDGMNDIHLSWGTKTKVINLPWQGLYLYREFLAHDGAWLSDDERARSWEPGEGVEPMTVALPYHYMLRNGEVQHVTATAVRQRHWKVWTWFGESTHRRALGRVVHPRKAWISDYLRNLQKRFGKPIHTLDIEFDGEVGERAGSWKGGTVGCGWEMKPGETVAAALGRMQRERSFR